MLLSIVYNAEKYYYKKARISFTIQDKLSSAEKRLSFSLYINNTAFLYVSTSTTPKSKTIKHNDNELILR